MSNRTAIVGWTGLVGQYLTQFFPESDLYNSGNIENLRHKSYNTLYFSGMPAEKWRINQSPAEDASLLAFFCELLSTVRCDHVVLISTVDVLDCTIPQPETGTSYAIHPYGAHRRQLEDFVQTRFPSHTILRLPGLFGTGLKKNVLFDLLHGNQLDKICLDSAFQWYNLEHLREDILFCYENAIPLIQLVTPPIATRDIVSHFFPEALSLCTSIHSVTYRLDTLYSRGRTTPLLEEIGSFIVAQRNLHRITPRIAVSNIAWSPVDAPDAKKILARYGINRIEMAFTTLRDWVAWEDSHIADLRCQPFTYPSCQSVLYKTDIHVFRDTPTFFEHMRRVLHLSEQLQITRMVFGSPKARHIYATTPEERIAIFRQLGDLCKHHGVTLCLEPNAREYGCTWLTNLADTIAFVRTVNHPHIRINFDFGNYIMEADTSPLSPETVTLIENVQVSAPFLRSLTTELLDTYTSLWQSLTASGYTGPVSLEVASPGYAAFLQSCGIFTQIIA
jgi:hypothetical protein